MIPPKPTSAAERNSGTRKLKTKMPTIPAPVIVPPTRIAVRRERPRVNTAAGIAPATTPSACAPASRPMANSSNPSDR